MASVTVAAAIRTTSRISAGPLVTPDSVSRGVGIYYYLGAYGGGVYHLSADYKGDAGEPITAYWHSKNTDMGDQAPQIADLFKTVERVKLLYVDTNETEITLSISTDDGVTWSDVTRTVGSGTGATAEEWFDFRGVTGKEFRYKLTHASADDNFQWVRIESNVTTQGAWFEVSA